MVTVNAVSVTVYTKKKSIACLQVFTPSAMRRFKKPCNCYGPRENDCMDLTLLIGLWRDRPFLPQNNPPPPPPDSPLLLLDFIRVCGGSKFGSKRYRLYWTDCMAARENSAADIWRRLIKSASIVFSEQRMRVRVSLGQWKRTKWKIQSLPLSSTILTLMQTK